MGDMLDFTMHKANVVCQWEISARIRDDVKNVRPWIDGKRHFDIVLHIKFSHAIIEQCEGEE
jgi:hypothetical protein